MCVSVNHLIQPRALPATAAKVSQGNNTRKLILSSNSNVTAVAIICRLFLPISQCILDVLFCHDRPTFVKCKTLENIFEKQVIINHAAYIHPL